MTANEVRDLGYLKWKDPWSWMESMKGKKWESVLRKETRNFNNLIKDSNLTDLSRQILQEIRDAQQYTRLEGFTMACGAIEIVPIRGSTFSWRWSWEKNYTTAYDLDVQGNIVWYITTEDSSVNKNKLICQNSQGKQIWAKKAVSLQVAIKDELCYYVKIKDYFNTIELCVCNAQTGGDEDVIYNELDKRLDLVLIKAANKTLYLKSSNVSESKLWVIEGKKLIPIDIRSALQMPLGESIYGDHCRLIKNNPLDAKWEARGKPLNEWIFPSGDPIWINIHLGLVMTQMEGKQALWYCLPNKRPKLVYSIIVGEIVPNSFTLWENSIIQSFLVSTPTEVPFIFHITNNKVFKHQITKKIENPINFKKLEVKKFHATSKDGTQVPYIIVKQENRKPRGLLVYVYGAYGATTPVGWPYQSWYPILKRGWAVSFAFVRGGGDNDFAWAELARRENRHRSIDDFEAVIRASQHKTDLGPDKTVIYGRSAGGVPVGAIVSRFPDGNLVGAAFAEVPYVDVLRTTTNPVLPLTVGEYNEFGNPIERIQNFKELLTVSPINTLPTDGAPGVFVLCRTGLLDRQVFAYEPFKWIQRLRGYLSYEESDLNNPKGKYISYEENEGHHYKPEKASRARAIDFAILEAWLQKKLVFR